MDHGKYEIVESEGLRRWEPYPIGRGGGKRKKERGRKLQGSHEPEFGSGGHKKSRRMTVSTGHEVGDETNEARKTKDGKQPGRKSIQGPLEKLIER